MEQWKNLENENELDKIIAHSQQKPVAIFKHSTRCAISAMAMSRLKNAWNDEEMKDVDFYYLDLLSHRNISNKIADQLKVTHQSPQIIVVKDGKAVYHNSHLGVNYSNLKENI